MDLDDPKITPEMQIALSTQLVGLTAIALMAELTRALVREGLLSDARVAELRARLPAMKSVVPSVSDKLMMTAGAAAADVIAAALGEELRQRRSH